MKQSLAVVLFLISVALCAIAQLAIVVATARASRRPVSGAERDVPHIDGAQPLPTPRRWLEISYAAAPALALAVLFAFTWRAIHHSPPGSQYSADPPAVAGPIDNR